MGDEVSGAGKPLLGPSRVQHALFVGLCWLGLLFVHWSEYGWPGAPPLPPPSAGDWSVGLYTLAYRAFALAYTAFTTLVFLHARKRQRKMSWAEYIVYVAPSLALCWLFWFVSIVLG